MKKLLLGASTVAVLMASATFADARMLLAMSDWSVNKVNASTPYCTMARQFEADAVLTMAKNAKGEGTIAMDFQRDAFDVVRPYPITLRAGGVLRQYVVKPANTSTIIMRTSTDESLFQGMEKSGRLTVQIDSEKFDIDLSGYSAAYQAINGCVDVNKPPVKANAPLPEKQIATKIPRPPVLLDKDTSDRNQEIQRLLDQNRRLTAQLNEQPKESVAQPVLSSDDIELREKLAASESRNADLMARVSSLEQKIMEASASMNPDMSEALAEKESQIALLRAQNSDLNEAVKRAQSQKPEVIVKEVIKEVPVTSANIRLAEAETKALSLTAERDEYRRLLQTERKRMRDMGDMAQQIEGMDNQSGNLVADVRRLEREKVDLIRQLEFAKSSIDPTTPVSVGNADALDVLSTQLDFMKNEIVELARDKADLERDLIKAKSKSEQAQEKLSAIQPAISDVEVTPKVELELQSMRNEIASLEATNSSLKAQVKSKADIVENTNTSDIEARLTKRLNLIEKQGNQLNEQVAELKISTQTIPKAVEKPELVAVSVVKSSPLPDFSSVIKSVASGTQPLLNKLTGKTLSRPPTDTVVVDSIVAPSPVETVQPRPMPVLSGDEIRRLIANARIPLQQNVSRVSRVSGPDFAAFKWDTGVVFGSAEQSRLSAVSAFDKSVAAYIQKTASRCVGSFDQNVQNKIVKGISVKTADIACVDRNGVGNAASVVFFARDNMFYALAHEADMNAFKVAMDMRDKLASSLQSVF